MLTNNTKYMGDNALKVALSQAGINIGIDDIRDLISGVVGSAAQDDSWLTLITPYPDGALRKQLNALKAQTQENLFKNLEVCPGGQRLEALRSEMKKANLDGFMIPRTDEHQGEFVAPRAERLRWLTGFSGSAGLAISLADKAAIFVDGRYTLQVLQQTNIDNFTPYHLTDSPPDHWITENLSAGMQMGYDPWLHSQNTIKKFEIAARKSDAELVPLNENLIDLVWTDQPSHPISPIVPHDIRYSGKSSREKRHEIAQTLEKDGVDAAILTLPDSVAWLLNIRGSDVSHTPLTLSYAILHKDGSVDWFVDQRKIIPGLSESLGNEIAIQPIDDFGKRLSELGAAGAEIRTDPSTAAAYVFEKLSGARIVMQQDPCALPKAIKNETEIAGMRNAHERDGLALTRFLHWLSKSVPKGEVTEITASDQLHEFRAESGVLRDLSFPTISSTGPNGAVVHYHATDKTNRALRLGELYLVDSGAQYLDGTTDVTRTIVIGEPTAEMTDRFTRVLKGHIAIATARFPKGTTGGQLDTLARSSLWQAGLDFDHGTGHGVGSYLGVHEGPHRISKGGGDIALNPGMIISNEPGYYKEGSFGIRIENLVVVRACEDLVGAERTTYEFETLTLAPIDLKLIDKEIMTQLEIDWLNAYHARVFEVMKDGLKKAELEWLKAETRPI
tara:strand:+ start:22827 stop:24845 length:2019 start_codon:yes stop_codon:yes gene_type:complete